MTNPYQILRYSLVFLAILLIQGISSGQSLYDVVISLSDRQRVFNQGHQVFTYLRNQNNETTDTDYPIPGDNPIDWQGEGVGTAPTQAAVDGLGIGEKIALLNQAVREFDSLKFAFLNSNPEEFASDSTVGALRPYTTQDFDPLPRATPENYYELLRLMAQRVRTLRLLQWPSAFREKQITEYTYAKEVLVSDNSNGTNNNGNSEPRVEIRDRHNTAITSATWADDIEQIGPSDLDVETIGPWTSVTSSSESHVGVSGTYNEDFSTLVPDPLRTISLKFRANYSEEARISATAPGGEGMQIGGTVYILRRSHWHKIDSSGASSKFEETNAGYLVTGSGISGTVAFFGSPPVATVNGAWVMSSQYGDQSGPNGFEKTFVEGGYQYKEASVRPTDDSGYSDDYNNSYEKNWNIGCIFYSVFKPTFTRGVDATEMISKLESAGCILADGSADGELLLHPRPSQLFGIRLGPGLKGAGKGYLTGGSVNGGGGSSGGGDWWELDANPLVRFDSSYSLRLAGSHSDYHVVYENDRTPGGRAQSLPSNGLGWFYSRDGSDYCDTSTLYRAWDSPRLKQIAGRDLVADVTYNANHYGGYTVRIYRRPTTGPAPTPGQVLNVSGMTLIRTWTFSHTGGANPHPIANREKLDIAGNAGEKYEIQADQFLPNQGLGLYNEGGYGYDWWWYGEGSYSWTLRLLQSTDEKLKRVIEIENDYTSGRSVTLTDSLDGQQTSLLTSMTLDPFTADIPADWTIQSAGKAISYTAGFDSEDPASGYGKLPISMSIDYDGIQPNAAYTWDAHGLLASETQGPWSTTGTVSGATYERAHQLNGSTYAKIWTVFSNGGNKLKTYSAPDGNAGSKLATSVSWQEVEYGTASNGLPGLPSIVRSSNGTGTTYGWNASSDRSYVLTLQDGLLSGSTVSRGTKLIQNVNTRGFATLSETFAIHGGTVKTGGITFSTPTAWGVPKKSTDYRSGLNSTWNYAANLSRLSTHSGYLGIASELSGYDALGRPGTVTSNGISAANTYTAFSTSSTVSGSATGSITDTRDTLGRLTSSSTTWNGVTDNLTITPNASPIGITRTQTLLGTHQATVRKDDGTVAAASGPTLPFGGTEGTSLSVDGGLLKTRAALANQSSAFQTTWTDAWGRIRKTSTPSTSGGGSDETPVTYNNPNSSLKRGITTEPSGRKLITESDPYDTSGSITRSGIDVNGNGSLGTSDRYVQSTTTATGSTLVTTLQTTDEPGPGVTAGLREILKTTWTPAGNITVTKINGNEETITRTPNYTAKTITTTSSNGWSKTETFNNLGLTTNSSLSGSGIPAATLTPDWRADGTLASVSLSVGGETHSASFNQNGNLASLNAPGRGNILNSHSISGGNETLTVDGVTTVTKLDGTQTTTSGSDVPNKTETLATSGSGFKQTTAPTVGASTEVVMNAAGAPTAKNYATGPGEVREFLPGGLLKEITLPRGGKLVYGYSPDGAKDLTSATWPQVTSGPFTLPASVQSYGHDRAGRVDEIGDSSGARALIYQNGRLKQTVWNSGPLGGYKIINGVDDYGRKTGFELWRGNVMIHAAQSVPNGVSGEVASVTASGFSAILGRNGARNLESITRGPVTQRWQRGTAGRILLADSNNTVSGAPSFNYKGTANDEATAFDAKGRRLKCATTGGEWVYQYTNGRLTSAVHPTHGNFSYQFDGIGRRTDRGSANTSDLLNRTLAWTNSQNKTLKVAAHPDARVWVGIGTAPLTEIPSFTGAYNLPITPPGAGGGWVPWNTLAVLEGEGDAGANPDAKAAQSGAVWVPPVNESFTFDAAGNRESSALWDFGWNGKNQLVRARTKNYNSSPQGYDITNANDAEGRRFSKKVNRYQSGQIVEQKFITFIHDGNEIIYERHQLPSGLTLLERKYVWGPDIAGGNAGGAGGLLLIRETIGNVTTDLYPLYDGTGHVIALTDSIGALRAEYGYGPFGEPLYARGPNASSCPFRYATKYWDEETGLFNFGKRFFDPITGQWLSREPLGESESINLYSYCHNDPINNVDVLGLAKVDLKAPPVIIPVPGLEGRFQVWFSVIEGGKSGDWENIGFYPSSILIGAASKLRLETDPAYRTRQGILAMRSMGDQLLLAGELELLKIKEDTATLLPGGHAAVAISREQYGAAAAWIVGEGVVATVGGELLGRGLSYGGKAGYLMATGSTMAESRLILGLSKELATGALTSGTPLAAAPLYAPANFVSRTLAASDSGGTSFLETYAFSAAKQSTQTTVLGENMMQRVIPFARKTNARTLPFGTTSAQWSKMTFQQRWKLNDGALRARINDGDLFRYIGQDPFRNPLLRQEFDLTGSELLRLNDRGIPFQIVSPQEVMSVLGHP